MSTDRTAGWTQFLARALLAGGNIDVEVEVEVDRVRALVRQLSVAVQQLHDGEDEEPEADHGGENAEDEHGGTAVVQPTFPGGTRIEIGVGDAAKSDARAEGGHEYQCDADDDADVEHGDSPFRLQKDAQASL